MNEYNPEGKDIRFIDSRYKDLFHIPDGGYVQINYPDETVVKPCKFIDEYHTQVGYNVFHICQFAEIMERNGANYMAEPEIMGDEAAWKDGKDRILAVQTREDGYDYTVKELQEILVVSRPTIYNLLKKNEFRWIQLDGGKYRISKKRFDD